MPRGNGKNDDGWGDDWENLPPLEFARAMANWHANSRVNHSENTYDIQERSIQACIDSMELQMMGIKP